MSEKTDKLTEVNPRTEERRASTLLPEDRARIREAVCEAMRRPFMVAGAIFFGVVAALIGQGIVQASWMNEIRRELAAQEVRVRGAGDQYAELSDEAVRRPELRSLSREIGELKNTIRSVGATVEVTRDQQLRLDSMLGVLSSSVQTISKTVSDEQDARQDLAEAIRELNENLRR